jgi:hypothetical protein
MTSNADSMTFEEWDAEVDRIEEEVRSAILGAAACLEQGGEPERAAALRHVEATSAAPGIAAHVAIEMLADDTNPELIRQRERLRTVNPRV